MINIPGIIWLVSAGGLFGAFFFLGLSWTISKGLNSKHSALWFLASFLIRTSGTIAGFYLISACQFERLALCLLGFFISGCAAVFLAKPSCLHATQPPQVVHNAS